MRFVFLFCLTVLIFCTTVFAGGSWGVYFPKDGGRPEANATAEELLPFGAYFMGNENDKVLYMTFDAGYESGLTAGMLDVLKKHEVPSAFFLVGHYFKTEQELIKRMVAEGHIVGNHTVSHPDMSKISDFERFKKELTGVEDMYREITGEEIPKFYRPPQGTYSELNLKHAQKLGYKTIFWTTTYKDWDVKNQPSKKEALSKMLQRTKPGSVILLHNVSQTNAEILDELISRYKEAGYRFESLYHLVNGEKQ